jgi:5'-3' exonuclease
VKLHLVDGTYELFRAFYSKRPDRPNKAVVGLIDSLLTLAADPEEQVTHVGVAFDNPIRSFRNDLFAGYKTEEGVDPELLAQFDAAEEATRALGMTAWPMDRFEADDALATAAARWAGEVEQVRILTPDKDLGQCIVGQKVVQVDRMRRKLIDEPGLIALRGIQPRSIPDWLALVGDTADGVPGLDGFGEKGAAAVLAKFVHLEQIPDDPRAWPAVRGAERLAATLKAERADAMLYRELTRLRTDAPIAESLDQLRWSAPAPQFAAWCERMDATNLLRRAVA